MEGEVQHLAKGASHFCFASPCRKPAPLRASKLWKACQRSHMVWINSLCDATRGLAPAAEIQRGTGNDICREREKEKRSLWGMTGGQTGNKKSQSVVWLKWQSFILASPRMTRTRSANSKMTTKMDIMKKNSKRQMVFSASVPLQSSNCEREGTQAVSVFQTAAGTCWFEWEYHTHNPLSPSCVGWKTSSAVYCSHKAATVIIIINLVFCCTLRWWWKL